MKKRKKSKNEAQTAENAASEQDTSTQETTEASEEQSKKDGDSTNESSAELDELSKVQADYAALNDKFLRLYSEFDNFRKRTAREKVDLIGSASGDIIKDLLPILDDFERAIKANEEAADPDSLKEGFELIHHKLLNILTAKGLQPMDAQGKQFDVDNHEAITNVPAPSDDMKGKVVDVVEKGYLLNEKVLRYAKVVVGQ